MLCGRGDSNPHTLRRTHLKRMDAVFCKAVVVFLVCVGGFSGVLAFVVVARMLHVIFIYFCPLHKKAPAL